MTDQPSAGTFQHGALASGRALAASEWLSEDPLLGLVRESGYIWGTVRDEAGTAFSLARRMPMSTDLSSEGATDRSLGGKLLVMASTADGMRLDRAPRGAVDSSQLVRRSEGEAAVITNAPDASGRPMELRLSPSSIEYQEYAVLELAGQIAVPGMQWYLPGADASLLYLTQTWEVTGSVLGAAVRGFLFYEEAWMQPGARLYISKDPLHNARYTTWYSWATHWDDGTIEAGHFVFGQDDFHVGLVGSSDGTVRAARRMDAVVDRDPDGYWHRGIRYELDGDPWVCEADLTGRMVDLGSIPNPQQEGFIHRVAESRRPEAWMAWGETVPANGDRRRTASPTA